MSKFPSRLIPWGVTLLLGVAAFLFWWLGYPAGLAYQEQLQLFLWTGDYLCSRLAEPGGVARYVAELLIQFYNLIVVGALFLAVIFMAVQRLTWQLMKAPLCLLPLSLAPVLLFWYALGSENVMLTYGVALLMALVATLVLNRLNGMNCYLWWAVVIVLMPFFYWITGPMALLIPLCVTPPQSSGRWLNVTGRVVGVLTVVLCLLLAAHVLPFPVERLRMGISYYRYVQPLPTVLLSIPLVVVLLRYLPRWLAPVLRTKGGRRVVLVVGCAALAGLLVLLPTSYDERTYTLMEYDYLVRLGRWDAIIKKSEQKQPDLPMSVCATNLALGMTNQLGERAFQFYQRGSDGLLPPSERNFSTQQLTGEAYFQLGLINTAQRFAFEAMEALPNYNKSGRAIKRLAETNLINGQYEVARKYLHILERTIFYRKWAQRTEALLDQEEEINSHPLYGRLRRCLVSEELLFSEGELDKICGQLFIHNPQNTMAMQYLLMFPLMNKDIKKFMNYMQVVQSRVLYNPRACQEGVVFAMTMQHQQLPKGVVSPMVERNYNEFGAIYNNEGKDSPRLEQFKHTLWYYYVK